LGVPTAFVQILGVPPGPLWRYALPKRVLQGAGGRAIRSQELPTIPHAGNKPLIVK